MLRLLCLGALTLPCVLAAGAAPIDDPQFVVHMVASDPPVAHLAVSTHIDIAERALNVARLVAHAGLPSTHIAQHALNVARMANQAGVQAIHHTERMAAAHIPEHVPNDANAATEALGVETFWQKTKHSAFLELIKPKRKNKKNSAGTVNPTTPAKTAAAVGHLAEASGVNIHDDKKADVVTAGAATAAAGMHATAELDGTHREAPKKADFDDAAAGAKHAEAPNKHHSPAVTQQRIAGEDSSAYIAGSTGEELQRMQAA